jgi:hypothetical protein
MNFSLVGSGIGAAVALISALYGGVHWHNSNFAWQEYVDARFEEHAVLIAMNDNRMSQNAQSDAVIRLRARIYQLEDRYGGPNVPKAPDSVKEEYRDLQQKKEEANEKLKTLDERANQLERSITK